jgi:hypothetical protein
MRRAALDIWKNIRAEGCNSARQYLKDNRATLKESFDPLWPLAATADFKLSRTQNDAELLHLLSTDDQLEISLRQISAAIFEKRTGDTRGARRMRAIRTPGSGADVAPEWLVDSVTTFSRSEHRRDEQLASEIRRRGGKDKGKGKGKEAPP